MKLCSMFCSKKILPTYLSLQKFIHKFQKSKIPCNKAKNGICEGKKGKVCEAKDLKKRKCECQAAKYPEEAGGGEEATEDPKDKEGKNMIY